MTRSRVTPVQMSFDDLMWNANGKPRAKKINPHSFRHWQNGLNTYSFWQCDICGLIVSDENYASGNYDHNCRALNQPSGREAKR